MSKHNHVQASPLLSFNQPFRPPHFKGQFLPSHHITSPYMSCLDICALNDPLIEEANPSKILYSLLIPNPKVYVSSTVGGNVDEQEETELKTHFLALETALM